MEGGSFWTRQIRQRRSRCSRSTCGIKATAGRSRSTSSDATSNVWPAVPLPVDADAEAAHDWAFGRTTEPPASVAEAIRAYLATADILGRRTGELHVALADSTDPAFAPEPITKDDVNDDRRLDAPARQGHLKLLETVLPHLDDRIQQQAREVLQHRDVLLQQFDELRELTGIVRTHPVPWRLSPGPGPGDRRRRGDPRFRRRARASVAKSAARRRSPLRDVAGMIRSFSYAALTAVGAVTQTRPETRGGFAPWADFWETWISASFLRAYLIATRGAAFLPSPRRSRRAAARLRPRQGAVRARVRIEQPSRVGPHPADGRAAAAATPAMLNLFGIVRAASTLLESRGGPHGGFEWRWKASRNSLSTS